jgi:predicted dehydrogenase
MVEAARRNKRVVQVGTHRRSSPLYQELAKRTADTMVGPVTVGRAYRLSNMWPAGIGKAEPTRPPRTLDWDMWLGPRPERDWRATLTPYKFRWWQQYSSQMGNWGVHYLDALRWLTGELAPTSICAMGGRFAVDDDRTVPDTLEACFQFASGRLAIFGQYEACGNPAFATDENGRPLGELELRGTRGTLYVTGRRYLTVAERGGQFQSRDSRLTPEAGSAEDDNHSLTVKHARNFLDCMRTRQRPNADIEIGHRSTSMSLMANISLATGQRLEWDAGSERFTNSDEANQLLHYEYRKPWTLG